MWSWWGGLAVDSGTAIVLVFVLRDLATGDTGDLEIGDSSAVISGRGRPFVLVCVMTDGIQEERLERDSIVNQRVMVAWDLVGDW